MPEFFPDPLRGWSARLWSGPGGSSLPRSQWTPGGSALLFGRGRPKPGDAAPGRHHPAPGQPFGVRADEPGVVTSITPFIVGWYVQR